MLAGERPEELVMPVRQRLVAGPAITGTVQRQRALIDNGAVTGRRPRLDLPGHGLAPVKTEGVKIKDANVRLVTPVGHRVEELWIFTVPLSPFTAAGALP